MSSSHSIAVMFRGHFSHFRTWDWWIVSSPVHFEQSPQAYALGPPNGDGKGRIEIFE